MAGYYDEQLIRDIESRVDIVEVIGETISLTRKGSRYWGLCPFHGEKTPSFCVTRERQMYYCFGCHEGGNIYTFLMKTQGLEFREALRILAERAGVRLPETGNVQKNQEKEEFLKLHQTACSHFQQNLKSTQGKAARQYLLERGVTEESMERFGLGYAAPGWSDLSDLLLKKGFSRELLEKSGLARISEKNGNLFDLLRNRVIFPIYQYNQSVIAFGGRTMEKDVQPKYLNSPETPIFSKRRNLYGLPLARNWMREKNTVFLVEGYMDCLKMSQAGIKNVVASLGTAFTSEQASLLHRYVERVVLLYDGDEAGQRETLRATGLLQQEGLQVDILTLPDEQDPDEFVTVHGAGGFYDFLKENRQSIIEFKLKRWQQNHGNAGDRESQSQLIRDLRQDFRYLPGEMERDHHIELLTMKLGVPENLIRRELNAQRKPVGRYPSSSTNKPAQNWNNNTENYTVAERVAVAMLQQADCFERVAAKIGIQIFQNPQDQALFKLMEQKRRELPMAKMEDIRYEAMQAGLDGRLAYLQMLEDTGKAAGKVLIDDFIVRVKKQQTRNQWEQLLFHIQQMEQQGTNLEEIKQTLLTINQVFHADRKGEKP